MAFHLPSVLKALLFSSGQPLSIKDIQDVFARYHEQHQVPAPVETSSDIPAAAPAEEDAIDLEAAADVPNLVTAAQIRDAMAEVSKTLESSGDVYLLDESAKGYRIVTNPQFAPWVRALRNEPPPARLTPASLETLAVVAYRQPVTRSEIEAVRGVSADAGLNKLLERELIYITGRAELPGRPLQYSTTDQFLEFVGVKSLVELPASDVLSPRQIDEWLKEAMNPSTPGDAEMGLPLEESEGDAPTQSDTPLAEPETETNDEAVVEASPDETAETTAEVPPTEPTIDVEPDETLPETESPKS